MTRLIPPVMRNTDLPLAVLSAARLDGILWSVHDGYCAVDEPDRPELRALALSDAVQPHDIVVGRTAAWVHGAGMSIVGPLEVRPRARPLAAWGPRMRYREIAIDDSEVERFNASAPLVTSRARTICDVAVDSVRLPCDVDLIVALCNGDAEVIGAYAADLAATCRRPGKAAGIELLGIARVAAEKRKAPPSALRVVSLR